jgi:hypothetical protein
MNSTDQYGGVLDQRLMRQFEHARPREEVETGLFRPFPAAFRAIGDIGSFCWCVDTSIEGSQSLRHC